MTIKFRPLLFLACLVIAVTGGGEKSGSQELFLTSKIELVNKQDAALIEIIAETLRNSMGEATQEFTSDRLDFVRADLNGDGAEEFIVTLSSSFACGNSIRCETSIYEKSPEGLRYIGSVSTKGKTGVMGPVINIEDNWSNGWRIMNNGEFRFCWLNITDPEKTGLEDLFGFPMEPGQAGYFTATDIGTECPKQHYFPEK